MWMNEHEVARLADLAGAGVLPPNETHAAQVLERLVEWTNDTSDGWPYWAKPARAADRLMDLLKGRFAYPPPEGDVSDDDLKRALTPVKSFLTRQGVSEVVKQWILTGRHMSMEDI